MEETKEKKRPSLTYQFSMACGNCYDSFQFNIPKGVTTREWLKRNSNHICGRCGCPLKPYLEFEEPRKISAPKRVTIPGEMVEPLETFGRMYGMNFTEATIYALVGFLESGPSESRLLEL